MTSRAGAGGTVAVRVEVQADGATLSSLGTYLKTLDKKMQTSVRKRIRDGISDVGQDLVDAVKQRASWSSRIPGTVRMATSFSAKSAAVTVTAGGPRAPHARPLEMGNKAAETGTTVEPKNPPKYPPGPRTLRHPIYPRAGSDRSSWTWVNQPTSPFFFAAQEARTPAHVQRMQKVLDDVARDIGFTE